MSFPLSPYETHIQNNMSILGKFIFKPVYLPQEMQILDLAIQALNSSLCNISTERSFKLLGRLHILEIDMENNTNARPLKRARTSIVPEDSLNIFNRLSSDMKVLRSSVMSKLRDDLSGAAKSLDTDKIELILSKEYTATEAHFLLGGSDKLHAPLYAVFNHSADVSVNFLELGIAKKKNAAFKLFFEFYNEYPELFTGEKFFMSDERGISVLLIAMFQPVKNDSIYEFIKNVLGRFPDYPLDLQEKIISCSDDFGNNIFIHLAKFIKNSQGSGIYLDFIKLDMLPLIKRLF
ncbi:MAG: hypothetical protein ACI9S8_001643 [Chlamydiales bacterium]|jgi:hypothetical protein